MSTLLYSGKIFQGRPESRITIPPSRLLVNVSVGIILDGSNSAVVTSSGVYSIITPNPRDPALDITFDCLSNSNAGVLVATGSIHGTWINISVTASVLTTTLSIHGTYGSGIIVSGLLSLTLSLRPGELDTVYVPFTTMAGVSWIKWSNIGDIDFTIGRDNVAGERPLDWRGTVYSIKKLGTRVVVYGAGGVSILTPADNTYGMTTIYRVGLKGKGSVTGDDSKHFFIDTAGKLWKLTDSLKLLGYEEYLSVLDANVTMSYNPVTNLVYISDDSAGYIYDVATGDLGGGFANLTAIGYQAGTTYVGAVAASLTSIPFEICTDIYDLGTRSSKTIYSLEFGVDLTKALYAAIDYRRSKAASFVTTAWTLVSPNGKVFITAWGREFRFRVKTLTYEAFELDYITVNGVANAY